MANSPSAENEVPAGVFGGVAYDAARPLPLGGWLIALGLFLVLYLVVYCVAIYLITPSDAHFWSDWVGMFTSGSRRMFFLAIAYTASVVILIISVIGIVYLLGLMFWRKRVFPAHFIKIFTWLTAAGALMVILSLAGSGRFDLHDIAYPLVPLLVWGSYLSRSERVKSTFLRP